MESKELQQPRGQQRRSTTKLEREGQETKAYAFSSNSCHRVLLPLQETQTTFRRGDASSVSLLTTMTKDRFITPRDIGSRNEVGFQHAEISRCHKGYRIMSWFVMAVVTMMVVVMDLCNGEDNIIPEVDNNKEEDPLSIIRIKSTHLKEDTYHMTCFSPRINHELEQQRDDGKEQDLQKMQENGCCREIVNQFLFEVDDDKWREKLHVYCLKHIAEIPSELSSAIKSASQVDAFTSQPQQSLADYSLVIDVSQHMLKPPTNEESMTTYSPWWLLSHQLDDSLDLENETSSNEGDGRHILASIQSSLSEDGGMHRTLSHIVSVQTPSISSATTTSAPCTWNTTIWIMLVVPEDFFMDMDDPLESITCPPDTSDCHVEYLLDANQVIDIEQPTFTSPQHVVGITLEFVFHQRHQQQEDENSSLMIQFLTKIHTRYPMPLKLANIPSTRVSVGLPAPHIIGGTWMTQSHMYETRDAETPAEVWYIKEETKRHSISNELEEFSAWLSTTVPAGCQEDYPWVAMITMICAVVGAGMTLRDLSLVSKWDET